jgi:hypothetical protein
MLRVALRRSLERGAAEINVAKADNQATWPAASWFETRGVAALLTMRV